MKTATTLLFAAAILFSASCGTANERTETHFSEFCRQIDTAELAEIATIVEQPTEDSEGECSVRIAVQSDDCFAAAETVNSTENYGVEFWKVDTLPDQNACEMDAIWTDDIPLTSKQTCADFAIRAKTSDGETAFSAEGYDLKNVRSQWNGSDCIITMSVRNYNEICSALSAAAAISAPTDMLGSDWETVVLTEEKNGRCHLKLIASPTADSEQQNSIANIIDQTVEVIPAPAVTIR